MAKQDYFAQYRQFKLDQHRRALARARHARMTGASSERHAYCLRMAALVRSTLAADVGARTNYRNEVTSGRF